MPGPTHAQAAHLRAPQITRPRCPPEIHLGRRCAPGPGPWLILNDVGGVDALHVMLHLKLLGHALQDTWITWGGWGRQDLSEQKRLKVAPYFGGHWQKKAPTRGVVCESKLHKYARAF